MANISSKQGIAVIASTIAETASNENDALVQELIAELTTHLLKFPR